MAKATRKRTSIEKERNAGFAGTLPMLDSPLQAGVHSEKKFLAYPFFDLARAPRRQEMRYQEMSADGNRVEILVNAPRGVATIYDRDLLIYVASLLRQRVLSNPGVFDDLKNPEHRTFIFTLHDFCAATSRSRGDGYDRIEHVVERLRTTSIRTTVRAGGERTKGWFNWLGEGTYVRTREEEGEETGAFICAVLCEWLFKAILRDGDMLAIPEQYFHLGPIERRLFDLAHVECREGDWHTTIGSLQARAGSDMLVRQFKAYLCEVGERGLPDYEVVLLAEFEKPADAGGKKRGGRPSVAYQKVIVRRRTTPFELSDKKSSKGKGLSHAKTKARKPPAQVEPLLLEYLNSKAMEGDAMSG